MRTRFQEQSMMQRIVSHEWGKRLYYLVICVGFYIAFAFAVFSIRHPWMTDVQRVLHMRDVILWRSVPKEQ